MSNSSSEELEKCISQVFVDAADELEPLREGVSDASLSGDVVLKDENTSYLIKKAVSERVWKVLRKLSGVEDTFSSKNLIRFLGKDLIKVRNTNNHSARLNIVQRALNRLKQKLCKQWRVFSRFTV